MTMRRSISKWWTCIVLKYELYQVWNSPYDPWFAILNVIWKLLTSLKYIGLSLFFQVCFEKHTVLFSVKSPIKIPWTHIKINKKIYVSGIINPKVLICKQRNHTLHSMLVVSRIWELECHTGCQPTAACDAYWGNTNLMAVADTSS